jgi:hypothetical protein
MTLKDEVDKLINEINDTLSSLDGRFCKSDEDVKYKNKKLLKLNCKAEGLLLGLDDELEFLQGKNMLWLVHEADLGSCHEEYNPLKDKIKEIIEAQKILREAVI